jgi:ELWxxDGT repeat protein
LAAAASGGTFGTSAEGEKTLGRRLAALGTAIAVFAGLGGSAVAAPGDAQLTQVADIRPGSNGSNPFDFAVSGGTLFFGADDGTHGQELWRSDGTAVSQVGEVNAASDALLGQLTDVNGTLFFSAENGTDGRELWKSNGTTVTQVEDINPTGDAFPGNLINVEGTLFFAADDGSDGVELWKSEPPYDQASTMQVEDINPTAGVGSFPQDFEGLGTTLLFNADDGSDGNELWKSEPPYTSATQVLDINPTGSSNPNQLAAVGGFVIFQATDGTTGTEPWKTNGTAVSQVHDVNAGGSSNPGHFTAFNGSVFFSADDGVNGREMWRTDPSFTDATLAADINPGDDDMDPGPDSSGPFRFTGVGTTLFFNANGGPNGEELWKTTGTGATEVADINPGGGHSFPDDLTAAAGKLFFNAERPDTGTELYVSDGTGATLVEGDLFPGVDSGSFSEPIAYQDGLFVRANDGLTGGELWKATIEGPAAAPPPATAPVKKKKCKTKRKKGKKGAVAAKKCKKKKK